MNPTTSGNLIAASRRDAAPACPRPSRINPLARGTEPTATTMTPAPLATPSGAMAEDRDPVCGMKVDPERAPAQGTYGGQKVYFCSATCRRKHETTHRPD